MQPVCEFLWMLRPEVLPSPHLTSNKSRNILLRRSLTRSCIRTSSPNYFGSWLVDTWLPGQPLISAQSRDEGKKSENSGSDFWSLNNYWVILILKMIMILKIFMDRTAEITSLLRNLGF
ncbi:hypothetical protein R6Q59_035114 [Mikania micrantha]